MTLGQGAERTARVRRPPQAEHSLMSDAQWRMNWKHPGQSLTDLVY